MAEFTLAIEGADESVPVETFEMSADRVPSKGEHFMHDGQFLYVHSVMWTTEDAPFVGGLVAHARVLLTPHRWRLS